MAILYSFLIGGAICLVAQLLTEIKIPFPVVAIILMVVGGGVLAKIGVFDWLCALGAGGVNVTAMGAGNGAYTAGTIISSGVWLPLVLGAGLNIILIMMGAACGGTLFKKFPEIFAKKPEQPEEKTEAE